jgi:hypothetical protein
MSQVKKKIIYDNLRPMLLHNLTLEYHIYQRFSEPMPEESAYHV